MEQTRSGELQQSLRGWFISARPVELLEAALGVLAISALDVFIPSQWGLLHLDLYALWIVVLAIAARYGAPAGYVAGILAAASFEIFALLRADPLQPPSLSDQIQPILLLTAGVIVSEVVRAHKRQFALLTHESEEATAALGDLTEQLARETAARGDLERRIATQPTSIAMVCTFAARLASLQTEEAYAEILEVVHRLIEAEACAIYLFGQGELRLKVGKPEAAPGRPHSIASSDTLLSRAVRERQVVTIRDAALSAGRSMPARPESRLVMAGPLLGPDGQILGVIVIERLPFAKFTPAAVRLFELILDWTARALANAQLLETAHAVVR